MPEFNIEYTEKDIKNLILQDLQSKMPGIEFQDTDIHIEVKTSENYRAEKWERGQFRGRVHLDKWETIKPFR